MTFLADLYHNPETEELKLYRSGVEVKEPNLEYVGLAQIQEHTTHTPHVDQLREDTPSTPSKPSDAKQSVTQRPVEVHVNHHVDQNQASPESEPKSE